MRSAVLFLILSTPMVLVACGGHGAGHEGDHGDVGHDAAGHSEHEVAGASASGHGLALDGDAKWEMDAHTRTVFAKMAGRFEGTEVDDPTITPDSWKRTGTSLKEDIAELIAGCTMQGPAHDELHKFLVSYMPAVDELAASGASKSATRVHELLEVYPDYFE